MSNKNRGEFVANPTKFTIEIEIGPNALETENFDKNHIESIEQATKIFNTIYDFAFRIKTKQYYFNETTGKGMWVTVPTLCK